MATFKILGDAMVITFGVSVAQLRKTERYAKNALSLRHPETKTEYFRVGMSKESSLSIYGCSFATQNVDGFPYITETLPEGTTDQRTYVKEKYGSVIQNINAVEAQIKAVEDLVTAEEATIDNAITIL